MSAAERPRARCRALGFLVAAAFVGATSGTPAHAADGNAEFLAALREAGFNDTAVAYLDWVEKSPLGTPEFQQQVAYERAVSLADAGRMARSRDERLRLLAEAAANFEQFNGAADDPVTIDAMWQSANLYFELAATSLGVAKSASGAVANSARTTALEHFNKAGAIATRLQEICSDRLAELPKPAAAAADPDVKALRDKYTQRQVEAQYLSALMLFERSSATTDADERDDELAEASRQFGTLVERYRDSVVGVSSRFYQGRCAQEQGDFTKALGCYEDLTSQPGQQDVFRRWAARAHRRAAECLIELDKLDEAIRGCERWLEASSPAEREQPEWLEVTYQLALASRAKLDELPDGNAGVRRLEAQVRDLMRQVASQPNDFQQDARLQVATLARTTPGATQYNTFAEALAGGKSAMELMKSSLAAVDVARENNPEAVGDLQRDAEANKTEALRAFATAIELADAKTDASELTLARFYLGWLYWEAGRITEAAVLSEYVATRHSESEYGPSAARVALASWEKLYQEARAAGRASGFAAHKLGELAQLMATKWPDAPESAAAVNILINIALSEDRIDEAQKLLAKLPAGARAGAELTLGSALWTKYLALTKENDAPFNEQAAVLRQQASTLLTSGFAGIRDRGPVAASAAVGGLYLVQLHLAAGNWRAALEVLEDKSAGPLTLVEARAEAASRPEFVLETYKAALRTFLSAQPPNRERAKAMMEALDKFVAAGGDDAGEQLTRVYVAVGLQLQKQVQDLTKAGNHVQAQQVAAAFGDVLDRVAQRPNAGDWKIRDWIARTNLEIGQGLAGDEATKYLTRARDAFKAVLAAVDRGQAGPDATAVLGVRKRLGDCLVSLGEYQAAVDQYALVLDSKQELTEVQVAAARALMAWGVKARRQAALNESVQGAKPQAGGRNLIWGWQRLSTVADGARAKAAAEVATNPAKAADVKFFENLFFEARYNIIRARYFGGMINTGTARRNQLEAARTNFANLKSLYPELGGARWKPAFEALEAQVNAEWQKG